MKLLDLPIYELFIGDETDGLTAMGLVDEPAIESNWILFDKHKPVQMSKDDKKQILFGAAMIPDFPIYRRDDTGEYYVKFSAETIEKMVEKWSKEGLTNQVNLMHNDELYTDKCTLVEMFVKNTDRGLNPQGYEDLPDGTLFVAYKVQEPLWGMIESGELGLNGFSIEANVSYRRVDMAKDKDLIDEVLDEISKKKVKNSNIIYYTAGELEEMMRANKVYDIEAGGKTYNCQIYAITDNGNGIEVMTVDKPSGRNQWVNIRIADIESVKVTADPYIPWETDTKSFKDYLNDEHTVTKSIIAAPSTIDEYIQNHNWLIINYNDEQDNPHTAARQCAIIARGLTYRGNSCVRVYETFGDSRSIAEGYAEDNLPDYRLMLEKRITSIRPMTFAEPWKEEDLDMVKLNRTGDDGMMVVYTHYSQFN